MIFDKVLYRHRFPGQGQHFATHQRQIDVTEHGLSVGFTDATDRKNSCLNRR